MAGSLNIEKPGLTPKGQATKSRIVDVAAELMFRDGVVNTSIDDVRKAAGVSGSQMTHYFTDKRELVREVIEHQADSIIEMHDNPLLGQMDSFEALETWASLAIELQKQRHCAGGCCFGSLAGQLAEAEPTLRDDLAGGFERIDQVLARGLRLMHERGDLRPEADPDELADVLLAAHQGGLLLTQTLRQLVPLEAALKGAIAYIRSFAA